jgi:mono/diheme cytochrome c family protein
MTEVRALVVLLSVASCTDGGTVPSSEPDAEPEPPPGPWDTGAELPAPPPNHGDAQRGEWLLLNGDYMSCGLPYKLWNFPIAAPIVQQALGQGRPTMPGRSGRNADLPYSVNAFTTADGAEVVNLNCLECHGGFFDGELVVGLGDPTRDFTDGLIGAFPVDLVQSWMLSPLLGFTQAERDNTEILLHTARALGDRTTTRTVGNNPADSLARVLAEHRDPETLAWSDVPLREVVFYGDDGLPLADSRFTSDPPPWWRVHKKNALFYNGMTRGPHRGTMEAASAICVDNETEAARIDGLFEDIQAFVESVRAPRYPRPIDDARAAQGRVLFARDCAGCHGSYGADALADETDTYPNLLIPLDVIATDPVIAEVGTKHAANVFEVYNRTFYGRVTSLHPGEPFPGYVPPPLDGIWATAPFLHNGSVPSVLLVLNSKARPRYWKRIDYDSTHFDEQALGWPFIALPYGQDDAPDAERKYIYDTTKWSQSNGGHTFGDGYSDAERRAVLEYLKTL